MDGKAWSHEKFTSPYDDEGPHVDEVRIGELELFVGKRILYLFDYGDEVTLSWKYFINPMNQNGISFVTMLEVTSSG